MCALRKWKWKRKWAAMTPVFIKRRAKETILDWYGLSLSLATNSNAHCAVVYIGMCAAFIGRCSIQYWKQTRCIVQQCAEQIAMPSLLLKHTQKWYFEVWQLLDFSVHPALSGEGFVLKSLECSVCRVRLGYGGVDACTVMTFFNPEHPRAEQANLGWATRKYLCNLYFCIFQLIPLFSRLW